MLRRFRLLRRLLADLGYEDARVRLEWISAAEGDRVRVVVNEMTEQLRALGPLDLPGRISEWNRELAGNAPGAPSSAAASPVPEVSHA